MNTTPTIRVPGAHGLQVGSIFDVRHLLAAIIASAAFLFAVSAQAQVTWQGSTGDGGDGTWDSSDATPWVSAVPTGADTASFLVNGTYTNPVAIVALTTNGGSPNLVAKELSVGAGKSVTLNFDDAVDLSLTNSIVFGANSQVTVAGPTAGIGTLHMKNIDMSGAGSSPASLVFKNYIVVTANSADSSMAHWISNKSMVISNNADVTINNLSFATASSSNSLILADAGKLTVGTLTSYASTNSIKVLSGSSMYSQWGTLSLGGATGGGSEARSNILEVSGTNSTLRFYNVKGCICRGGEEGAWFLDLG